MACAVQRARQAGTGGTAPPPPPPHSLSVAVGSRAPTRPPHHQVPSIRAPAPPSAAGDSGLGSGADATAKREWGAALSAGATRARKKATPPAVPPPPPPPLETVTPSIISPAGVSNSDDVGGSGPSAPAQPRETQRQPPASPSTFASGTRRSTAAAAALAASFGFKSPPPSRPAAAPRVPSQGTPAPAQPAITFVQPSAAGPIRRAAGGAPSARASAGGTTRPRVPTGPPAPPPRGVRLPKLDLPGVPGQPPPLRSAPWQQAGGPPPPAARTRPPTAPPPPPPRPPPRATQPPPRPSQPPPPPLSQPAPAASSTTPAPVADPAADGSPAAASASPPPVSFAAIMGKAPRRGPGATIEAAEAAAVQEEEEEGVVDLTWRADPELDALEEEGGAQQQQRQRQQQPASPEAAAEAAEAAARARAEAAEAEVQAAYAGGGAAPGPYVGPVEAARVAGSGWGLVATEDVPAGELLLVAAPALLQRGRAGEVPEFAPLLASALRLLRRADGVEEAGAPGSGPVAPPLGDALALASLWAGEPRAPPAKPPADLAAWRQGQARDGGGGAAAGRGGGGMRPWPAGRVMSLLQLNLIAEDSQDGAAAMARHEPLSSVAGVWPEAALINHSCAPNCTAVLLGDRLVVRATRPIPSGSEVSLSWLAGSGALRPLEPRRADLVDMYGFSCRCWRCAAESSERMAVPFMYADAQRDGGAALEAMQQALESRDLALLQAALGPLQEVMGRMQEAAQQLGAHMEEASVGLRAAGGPGAPEFGEDEAADGGRDDDTAGGRGSGAAQGARLMGRTRGGAEGAGRRPPARGGTGGGAGGGRAAVPVDRETAEAWLLAGAVPLLEALLTGLAARASWLGVELGPGWPQEPALLAGAGPSGAPAGAEAAEAEERQAEAAADLLGFLAMHEAAVGKTLPGSELHTRSSARLLALARQLFGGGDPVAEQLAGAAYAAHALRYGPLEWESFEALAEAGLRAADELRASGAAGQQVEGGGPAEAALSALFEEDARLRSEAAAAAIARPAPGAPNAAAGATSQAPRRPLPRREAAPQAGRSLRARHTVAPPAVQLPEDVAAADAAAGSSGGEGLSPMEEAELELQRLLAAKRPAAGGPQRRAGAAPGAAGAPASVVGDEAALAALRERLMQRDEEVEDADASSARRRARGGPVQRGPKAGGRQQAPPSPPPGLLDVFDGL